MNKWIQYIDKEQFFTARACPINEAVIEFEVYRIAAIDMLSGIAEYEKKGGLSGADSTTSFDEALLFCSGTIKFDGCCDMKFDEQETVTLHFCGNPWAKFKSIMDRLYLMAAELMPESKYYLLKKDK